MVASDSEAGKHVGGTAEGGGVSEGGGIPERGGVSEGGAVPERGGIPDPGVVPTPGRPVRGSRSGRPVMVLLDLLGRRWALRVLWELRDGPVPTFRELQQRCDGVSSSVLSERVRELRTAGIVTASGFELTAEGRELISVLAPVDEWAKRWAKRARARHSA